MVGKYRWIGQIENFFSKLLTGAGISDNVFVGNLPLAIESKWKTIAYADVNRTTDRNAYGQCSANIYLFAKPIGSRKERDVRTLERMEAALMQLIEEYRDAHYVLHFNWSDSSFDETRQLHYIIVNVGVTIKSCPTNDNEEQGVRKEQKL